MINKIESHTHFIETLEKVENPKMKKFVVHPVSGDFWDNQLLDREKL